MCPNDVFDRFPVRKNPRCTGYNYRASNYYFVTVCTREKKWLFGKPGVLNRYGEIAYAGLVGIRKHFPGVSVDKMVVMPNHVHAIIILAGDDVHLSTVIGQYKSFVSKEIHCLDPDISVWQASFHDHVIRNQQSYEKICGYIEGNPLKWQEDCYMQDMTDKKA